MVKCDPGMDLKWALLLVPNSECGREACQQVVSCLLDDIYLRAVLVNTVWNNWTQLRCCTQSKLGQRGTHPSLACNLATTDA